VWDASWESEIAYEDYRWVDNKFICFNNRTEGKLETYRDDLD
jgi:hypothetical protein